MIVRALKSMVSLIISAVYLLFAVVVSGSSAGALANGKVCNEAYLRDIGVVAANCSGDLNKCQVGPSLGFAPTTPSREKVFVIGDSLTFGMVKYGGLLDKIAAKGMTVDTVYAEPTNITVRGTSVEATGGYAIQQTNQKLSLHSKDIEQSGILMVALGTNPDDLAGSTGNFVAQMKTFVERVRSYNPSIKIYWVNTYYQINNRSYPTYDVQNQRINEAAQTYNFSGVIDVAAASESGELLKPNGGDNIHYSPTGYKTRSEWLAEKLAAASGDASQGVAGFSSNTTPTSTLTEDQRIAQTFIVGFTGAQSETMRAMVKKYKLGGVYILGRDNAAYNKAFFDSLNNEAGTTLLVASDEEGGKVQRFASQIGAFPSARELGAKTNEEVEATGRDMGYKLKALGVNVNLAPVADINDAVSDAINGLDRGFSDNPDVVADKALAFAKGLRASGVSSVYKHFPGLGTTPGNTDNGAQTSPSLASLQAKDLKAYEKIIDNDTESIIMMNNAKVPNLTAENDISSTSTAAVNYLRNNMGYTGMITTDDLRAGGVPYSIDVAVTKSLQAGVTMPLFGFSSDADLQNIINAVKSSGVDVSNSLSRAISFKRNFSSQAPNTSVSGNCVCPANSAAITLSLSEEERFSQAWGFFTTVKGLSPEAASGMMGNLKAESGIDPNNMQNNAPLPDSPTMPVRLGPNDEVYPAAEIEGKFGYGIAQWTSAGRQKNLIDFAAAQGKSTGALDLQLDFLWKELTESYTSVLAKLQTPGVTVQEASDTVTLRFMIPATVLPPPRGTEQSKADTLQHRGEISAGIFARYNGSAGSFSPSASCASGSNGVSTIVNVGAIDQVTTCAANTETRDIVTGYRAGKPHQIQLCYIPDLGVQVNAQVSSQVLAMVTDAKSSGVELKATDGFRSLENQITLYNRKCQEAGITPTAPPFPKASADDSVDCPGVAAPGYSNHGMGVAIDFIIPQSYSAAVNNNLFKWLLANGSKYGFYEWGKGLSRNAAGYEAWHWSIDGN